MHHFEFRLAIVLNSLGYFILCILNGCQPKKPGCRKASGLFCTHFSQCDFNRCQTLKTPCGWDLNLNNQLFRGDFAIFQSHNLPFFRYFKKIFVNYLCLKRGLQKLFLQSSFLFSRKEIKNEACYSLPQPYSLRSTEKEKTKIRKEIHLHPRN